MATQKRRIALSNDVYFPMRNRLLYLICLPKAMLRQRYLTSLRHFVRVVKSFDDSQKSAITIALRGCKMQSSKKYVLITTSAKYASYTRCGKRSTISQIHFCFFDLRNDKNSISGQQSLPGCHIQLIVKWPANWINI